MLMKTHPPVVALFAICIGLLSFKAGLNAAEPFDEYIGDWLFREDRNQVWTGAEDTVNGGVILFEKYNAICGLVKRKWVDCSG